MVEPTPTSAELPSTNAVLEEPSNMAEEEPAVTQSTKKKSCPCANSDQNNCEIVALLLDIVTDHHSSCDNCRGQSAPSSPERDSPQDEARAGDEQQRPKQKECSHRPCQYRSSLMAGLPCGARARVHHAWRPGCRFGFHHRAGGFPQGQCRFRHGPGGFHHGPGGLHHGPGGLHQGPAGFHHGSSGFPHGPTGFSHPGGFHPGFGGYHHGHYGHHGHNSGHGHGSHHNRSHHSHGHGDFHHGPEHHPEFFSHHAEPDECTNLAGSSQEASHQGFDEGCYYGQCDDFATRCSDTSEEDSEEPTPNEKRKEKPLNKKADKSASPPGFKKQKCAKKEMKKKHKMFKKMYKHNAMAKCRFGRFSC